MFVLAKVNKNSTRSRRGATAVQFETFVAQIKEISDHQDKREVRVDFLQKYSKSSKLHFVYSDGDFWVAADLIQPLPVSQPIVNLNSHEQITFDAAPLP